MLNNINQYNLAHMFCVSGSDAKCHNKSQQSNCLNNSTKIYNLSNNINTYACMYFYSDSDAIYDNMSQ